MNISGDFDGGHDEFLTGLLSYVFAYGWHSIELKQVGI